MNPRTPAVVVATLGTCALALGAAMPASAADEDKATVSVLHAVPGLTVDVYANGDELLPDFKPGTLTEPQELPAGSYDLKVFPVAPTPRGLLPSRRPWKSPRVRMRLSWRTCRPMASPSSTHSSTTPRRSPQGTRG